MNIEKRKNFIKYFFITLFIIFSFLLAYIAYIGLFTNIIFYYKPIKISPSVVRGSIYSSDNKVYATEGSAYRISFKEGISKKDKSAILNLTNNNLENISSTLLEDILKINKTHIKSEKYYYRLKALEPHLNKILGVCSDDLHGINGLEALYDNELSPEPILNSSDILYGNNLHLSIDSNLQFIIDKLLSAYELDEINTLIVDNKDGSIKAHSFSLDNDFYKKTYPRILLHESISYRVSSNKGFDRFLNDNKDEGVFSIYDLAYYLSSLYTKDNSFKDLSIVNYIDDVKMKIISTFNPKPIFNDQALLITRDLALKNIVDSPSFPIINIGKFEDYQLGYALGSKDNRYSIIVILKSKEDIINKVLDQISKSTSYILKFF